MHKQSIKLSNNSHIKFLYNIYENLCIHCLNCISAFYRLYFVLFSVYNQVKNLVSKFQLLSLLIDLYCFFCFFFLFFSFPIFSILGMRSSRLDDLQLNCCITVFRYSSMNSILNFVLKLLTCGIKKQYKLFLTNKRCCCSTIVSS